MRLMFAEKIKTHILFSTTFFPKNLPVYEIMWENMVEPDRPDDNTSHAFCMLDN